jgi:nifR3 family TIM-barrel protein
MGAAVRILTNECGADHIDVNVGCPAAKVTRKGGGAALPAHPVLFGRLMEAAVAAAGSVPVTVKMRMGLNDEVRTDITAATRAANAGVAAVTLHARTAEQLYAGPARWPAIAELVEAVGAVDPSVPVLGNGDIFSGADATRMMATTGCAGVVVGRGVLGRPWLFAGLAAAFAGEPPPPPPTLATVIAVMGDHLALLVDHAPRGGGNNPGEAAVRDFRKHVNWYLHGFPVGRATRQRLMAASSPEQLLGELSGLCETVDGDAVADPAVANQPRGHTHGPRPVSLPDRWLEFPDDPSPPRGADALVSGG